MKIFLVIGRGCNNHFNWQRLNSNSLLSTAVKYVVQICCLTQRLKWVLKTTNPSPSSHQGFGMIYQADIKQCSTVDCFKSRLKSLLFKKVFQIRVFI